MTASARKSSPRPCSVLDASRRASSATSWTFTTQLIGGAALRAGLPPLPDDTLAAAKAADAVLLGAVGDPAFDDRPPAERPEAALLAHPARAGRVRESAARARVARARETPDRCKPDVLARHGPDRRARAARRAVLRSAARHRRRRRARPSTRCATRGRRSSASRASRSSSRSAPQAGSCRSTRRTCSKSRGSGGTSSPKSRSEYPDVTLTHELVDAAAMKLALAPSQLRRHAHGEHVRRHSVGRSRRDLRIARPAAVGEPRSGRRVCSSRCTARRRTSPARTSRIRSARSRRPRCCCRTDWDCATKAPRSSPRSSASLAAGLRTADIAACRRDRRRHDGVRRRGGDANGYRQSAIGDLHRQAHR